MQQDPHPLQHGLLIWRGPRCLQANVRQQPIKQRNEARPIVGLREQARQRLECLLREIKPTLKALLANFVMAPGQPTR
ncbi:MAG TPA: hypothetical protein VFX90_06485 [Rhodoferax sp.]|nr:hypothetical protein [Rhodoferax sp.]